MARRTKLGLYGGPAAFRQKVVGIGAFVAAGLGTPTMTGSGLADEPDPATGTGVFVSPGLAGSFAGAGETSGVAFGTGVFTRDINLTFVGAGIAAQGVYSAGGLVSWEMQLQASSAGVGTSAAVASAAGSGAFAGGDLAPTQAGSGTSVPPQQVTATGAFASGDLATPVQVSAGESQAAGTVGGTGTFARDLTVSSAGTSTAVQPQQVAASGAMQADLQVSSAGTGATSGVLGTGIFVGPVIAVPVSAGTGLVEPPPVLDIGWEDDDVTWGGLQLTSKDFAPVYASGQLFSIIGQATDVHLDLLLERQAIVHERGHTLVGRFVEPQFDAAEGSTIQISLGGHETPDGAVDWEGPYDFVVGVDTFIDFSIEGRYLAIRFASSGIASWSLQSFDIDYEIVGAN